MKRLIVLVTVILVLGSIPASTARHRSVGAEETVAVSQDDEPTVPDNGDGSPFQVGTTPKGQCYEASADASPDELQRAANADGFCGALIYNADGPESLRSVSNPDQHIPSDLGSELGPNPIDTFDVVKTELAGVPGGLTLCTPFCDGFLLPNGNERHQLFYDTVSETGLTHDSETTKEEQRNNRRNYVSAQAAFPNAGQAVQKNTGAWQMNGWVSPAAESTFVAFIEDDGETVTPLDLKAYKDTANLPENAAPTICGFSPDTTLSTTKSDNFCELELKYFDNGDSLTRGDFKEYGDRCKSPTYTCHAVQGAAWRQSPPLYAAFESGGVLANEGVGENTPVMPSDDNKYRTWHWVALPAPPTCPVTEPGFSFDDKGTAAPYLAHDLDVYTPITRLSGPADTSPGPISNYAKEVAGGPVDTVQETLPLEDVEEVVDEVDQTADEAVSGVEQTIGEAQDETIGHISKADRVEPNADPANNPGADTSQDSTYEHPRALSDCLKVATGETDETTDPWVNMIETDPTYTATTSPLPQPYQNDDSNQDEDNAPGPVRMFPDGNVGLFADANDDGFYNATGDPYSANQIQTSGAYPMLWGMRLDANNQVTNEGTCELGNDGVELSTEMERMGYGINTGIFEVIYLKEPTRFDSNLVPGVEAAPGSNSTSILYQDGNNIYLLASQSVKQLWTEDLSPDSTQDTPLDNEVDEAIKQVRAFAIGSGANAGSLDVETPGTDLGFDSDFDHQCLASTGEYDSKIAFTHNCNEMDCSGDTILSKYVFEIENTNGQLDEGDFVPSFNGLNDQTSSYSFSTGVNTWTDVDPLDNNPDRNDDEDSKADR
jgi:hypothetical protein